MNEPRTGYPGDESGWSGSRFIGVPVEISACADPGLAVGESTRRERVGTPSSG